MKTRLLTALLSSLLLFVPAMAQTGGVPVVPAAEALEHPAPPKPLTPFAQAVVDTQKAFLAALDKGDADYVKNAVADDFVVIGTNGDMGTKAELLEYVHPHENKGPAPILYDFQVVQLSDTAAVVTYKSATPHGGLDRYQHLSDTWVKVGDQWKLKFEQTTLNLWSAHDL
jgi:hypothetical protein